MDGLWGIVVLGMLATLVVVFVLRIRRSGSGSGRMIAIGVGIGVLVAGVALLAIKTG